MLQKKPPPRRITSTRSALIYLLVLGLVAAGVALSGCDPGQQTLSCLTRSSCGSDKFPCTLLSAKQVAAVIGGDDEMPMFERDAGLEVYASHGEVRYDRGVNGCIWSGGLMWCDGYRCPAQLEVRFDPSYASFDSAKSTNCGNESGSLYDGAHSAPVPPGAEDALFCPDALLVRTASGVLSVHCDDQSPEADAVTLAADAIARL